MSESYASKRERWQKLLEALPVDLRQYVSLRNVEAVSALPPAAQSTLVLALQAGLKRLGRAVEILRESPKTSVAELLEKVTGPAGNAVSKPVAAVHPVMANTRLAGLIQLCYPDMPQMAAEALSASESLAEVRQLVSVIESLLSSPHLRSDFVVVVFHGCLQEALERLDSHLAGNPACQQAVYKSGLNHTPMEVHNV